MDGAATMSMVIGFKRDGREPLLLVLGKICRDIPESNVGRVHLGAAHRDDHPRHCGGRAAADLAVRRKAED